jgi:hypothetical protein
MALRFLLVFLRELRPLRWPRGKGLDWRRTSFLSISSNGRLAVRAAAVDGHCGTGSWIMTISVSDKGLTREGELVVAVDEFVLSAGGGRVL